MRKLLLTCVAGASIAGGAMLATPAAATVLPLPASARLAIQDADGVSQIAYVCRPVWRCGPYGCGWRRACWWRPGPYYYGHRPYGFYRPYGYYRPWGYGPYWGYRRWGW